MSELSKAVDRLEVAVRIAIAGAWFASAFAFALCAVLAAALLGEATR